MHFIIVAFLMSFILGCSQVPHSSVTESSFNSSKYIVVINGFNSKDRLRIEQKLMSLDGYDQHRISVSTEYYTEYWYESFLGTSTLDKDIHKSLKFLNLDAIVQFSGNTFTIISTKKHRSRLHASDLNGNW